MSVSRRPKDLQRRLLKDIAEIRQDPYPNIHLHIDDSDVTKACLILTPHGEEPLHLTIDFPTNYPLVAPNVSIQSRVLHPNVFGGYICASILNTSAGWTPAYTLKAVAIQLLSFFSSESIEQHGGREYNLMEWRLEERNLSFSYRLDYGYDNHDFCTCDTCGFGLASPEEPHRIDQHFPNGNATTAVEDSKSPSPAVSKLLTLPDEVLLLTLAEMDTRDVLTLANVAPSIKRIVQSYDFIRVRELQCFCLKKSFFETKLGIGISISGSHQRPVFRSEFDLLSQEAFFQNQVDRSIQGIKFDKWLPLPLNRRHWCMVKTTVGPCLKGIQTFAGMSTQTTNSVDVLYHFMNNVVVQFSADYGRGACKTVDRRSTLNHVSEKAIEAYFALFHLLLCLATEDLLVVTQAKDTVKRFLAGPRTKVHFPDLGHVLIAALISNAELTQELALAIIKEAILRNVVWMLDAKGAGMAELAYLEPSAVSEYRLGATFKASTTSYRLLMFLKVFSQTAMPCNRSLVDLREALFDTHGAPPAGTSALMAHRIREIHSTDSFPDFLSIMGIKQIPSKTKFTAFLRRTVTDSMAAGYSTMPMSQSQLFMIRRVYDPTVEIAEGVHVTEDLTRWFERGEKWHNNGWKGRPTFFPGIRIRRR